jgi:DtxR family Mn-dependent transcriptional regulator
VDSGGAASTKGVAERLAVSAASVSNMFARLQEMGLVEYERYRGATLTARGRREALRLVRRHRLIEIFLLEHLGYDWQEVHEEAERLEHAVSDSFTERLAELLGHPNHDPHGDPIPSAEGILEVDDSFTLSQAIAGRRLRIVKVNDEDAAMLDYFGDRNLFPGRLLTVREARALDGVVIVEDEEAEVYALGEPLARSIFVKNG